MLNISRLFLLAFTLLLSYQSFANVQYTYTVANCSSNCIFDNESAFFARVEQVSNRKKSEYPYVWSGTTLEITTTSGSSLGAGGYRSPKQTTCEQKYDSGMFWGATSAPATFCDGQCEWKVEKSSCGADYNQDGTFTGASSCAYDAQTNGNTCSQQTGTPQNPTPTPPPPNSPCGPGKTMGVINGTTICVNNSAPPPNCQKLSNGNYNCVPKDPNDPNTPPNPNNPPNNGGGSGGCTSNCNNTTNNNTTNNNTTNNTTNNTSITNNTTEAPAVDLSPVIDKLNQVDTGIKAVDNSVKALATGIKAVETAIKTTSQTITNAINVVKDKVTDVKNSVDTAATQAKTDAATQKAATDAAKEQAKTDAAAQKGATEGVKSAVDQAKEQAKTDAATQKAATDDVKKAVEEQTGQQKGFFDWFKTPFSPPSDDPTVPTKDLGGEITGLDGNLINAGKQCPASKVLSMNLMNKSFSYTFEFTAFCQGLSFIGGLIKILAYLHAGYIVLGATRK